MADLVKIGFLASGRGSNMQAVIDACEHGKIKAKPAVVISNNPDSLALERGKKHGLASYCMNRRTHKSPPELDNAISDCLKKHEVSLVVLVGYMRPIGEIVLEKFHNRIINIHPALLPKFGGKGMFGMNVHQAVVNAGENESGATVHLVNQEYDQGRIIAQSKVKLDTDESAESLAAKVLSVEHALLVDTIAKILDGEISL